jgi:ubiquitin-protein ligase
VHPNISCQAGVCINGLRADYKNQITIRQIIEGIISALKHPNAEETLTVTVGNLQQQSEARFEQAARNQVTANILSRASQSKP